MPDYANGKIYKIVNTENEKVYIGSTTQRLWGRMRGHRYQAGFCESRNSWNYQWQENGRKRLNSFSAKNRLR